MLENIFTTVLNMSITASVAAVLIIFFRWVFGQRLPGVFSYALWAIVLVRLLIPFSLPSMFSIFNLIPVPETVITHSSQNNGAGNTIPYGSDYENISAQSAVSKVLNNEIKSLFPAATPELPDDRMRALTFVVSWIWVAGAAGLFLLSMVAYLHARRKLKTASILYKDNRLISQCSRQLKLKRKIPIYTSDNIHSPVVCGLVQPRIIIPTAFEQECNKSELKHIITHELVHIKRFDYIIKPLAVVAVCVHWFNPIIWLSFILSQKDMEMACDERVMSANDIDMRSEYASSLIKLAIKQNILLNGGLLAFGESNIKSRIKGIMKFKKPGFWLGITTIVILVVISLALLTNGQNKPVGIEQKGMISGVNENQHFNGRIAVYQATDVTDVEMFLDEIMKNKPSTSSNPYDEYIKDSEAFDKLVALGYPALEYMFKSFTKSNRDGLKEYIMAVACAKIMGVYDEEKGIGTESGREWFNKYAEFEKDTDFHIIDADYDFFRNTYGKPGELLLPAHTDMKNMEDVISNSILSINRRAYQMGEKAIESHKIYRTEYNSNDRLISVYMMVSFHWFGFENGMFKVISGCREPVMMQLKKSDNLEYEVLEYKQVIDESGIQKRLVREVFPKDLAELIIKGDDTTSNELWDMQVVKAQKYLEEINRADALIMPSVPKAKMDEKAAAAIKLVTSIRKEFPDWNGTKEILVRTGGKFPGINVRGILETECIFEGEDRYTVTLTRTWNVVINGIKPISYWRYKVTGEQMELVDERDEDAIVRAIK